MWTLPLAITIAISLPCQLEMVRENPLKMDHQFSTLDFTDSGQQLQHASKWLHLHSTISEFSHLLVCGSGHAILFHAVNVISIYFKCLLHHVPYLFHQIPSNIFHNNFSMFIVLGTYFSHKLHEQHPTHTNKYRRSPSGFFRRSTGGNSRIPNAVTPQDRWELGGWR